MGVELFIARRYLKAKRKEGFISLITFLSVAGVMVGVMALVVVIAVMNGAESEFRRRILGLEPHILVMNYNGTYGNYTSILKEIQNTPRIRDVSPILFAQAMIRTRHALSGVMVRGIIPDSSASLIKGFDETALENALSSMPTMTTCRASSWEKNWPVPWGHARTKDHSHVHPVIYFAHGPDPFHEAVCGQRFF
jgi:lipoprotein-releasing system permease protein